jgi:hypothetical protein
LRHTGKHTGQRLPGLVDPRPQEPPVTLVCQRLVLGVYGRQQLLEQAADLDGPVLSLVVGCTLGQEVSAADEVDQGGPQSWPRQGRCPAVSAVRTAGSWVLVAARVPASSDPYSEIDG